MKNPSALPDGQRHAGKERPKGEEPMKKYDVNAPIVFKKGFHELNAEPHLNYQLNRMINWSGGDLEEVDRVSRQIRDFDDWKKILMELGARALAEERIGNAIAYYRMAEFYMDGGDPDALACYNKARELFYGYFADYFTPGSGSAPVVERLEVPYEDVTLPVMHTEPERKKKGVFLVHGGNDSYYEEFFFPMLYLRERGYEVYLFEGPGQGAVTRLRGLPFTAAWEKPVAAITARFDLRDVAIVGVSLGGYFAPRAAAFDKRISRVIGWSVFPSFWDVYRATAGKARAQALRSLLKANMKSVVNGLFRRSVKKGDLHALALAKMLPRYGAATPFDLGLALADYDLAPVAEKIDQDVLILGAQHDIMIPYTLAGKEIAMLKNARSLTFRLFTDREEAGDHCSCGNTQLALDSICRWMDALDARDRG